jgi:glycopeptide antibiotics resistance protein
MAPFAARLLATALPLAIFATVAAAAAYALSRRSGEGDPGHARRVATRAVLAVYGFGLAWWTVGLANPNHNGGHHANLVPFREIVRSLTDPEPGYGLLNFWGNIVAFVPVGALAILSLRPERRWPWLAALLGGTLGSVTLETAQYFVGRSADVDDVILNTVGVGLGIALITAGRRLWRLTSPKSRPENGRFP